jgi:hypothetical protein
VRWPIVRTLLAKEVARLAGHRGALALIGLLAAAALLLRAAGPPAVDTCWIDYWEDGPWIRGLRASLPPELRRLVRFRPVADAPVDGAGILQYGLTEGAIQLRPLPPAADRPRVKVWVWYPGDDPAALAAVEDWFWRAAREGTAAPELVVERSPLRGLDVRRAAAAGLVLFAVFFVCVCMLPAVACEEKERGTWAAQTLTPATAADAVAAKALCYVPTAAALAIVLAGLARPAVWAEPFFWPAVAVAAVGAFGLGITIAALAPTQRAAGIGALGYAVAAAVVVAACRRLGVSVVPALMLEAHVPANVFAAVAGDVLPGQWRDLAVTAGLAAAWVVTGTALVCRRWRPT